MAKQSEGLRLAFRPQLALWFVALLVAVWLAGGCVVVVVRLAGGCVVVVVKAYIYI